MAISQRLRYEVLRRDGFRCRYCGAPAPDARLEIDHVVPESLGGPTAPENLATACSDCNTGKSSVPPDAPTVAEVREDALRYRRALEYAGDEAVAARIRAEEFIAEFDEAWRSATLAARPSEWETSIEQFLLAGLQPDDLRAALHRAARKRVGAAAYGRWRYFCGAAWGMVSDRQQRAREIVSGGYA